ncbi:MAG: nucleotidyltransferase family protein [Acidimicrobiales bacterium]
MTSSQGADVEDMSWLVHRVAGYGLQGAAVQPSEPFLAAPLPPERWRLFLDEAGYERVLGLVAGAVSNGMLAVTEEQAGELHEHHVAQLCGDLLREGELVGVVALLSESGLDYRVLKGAGVAHLDYPDPAMRSFCDVDLLVRSDEWDEAMAALQAHGWRRQFGEPRPGFDRRFVKAMLLTRDGGASELDLHRTLALGPFGLTVVLADLWQHLELVSLAGMHVRALGRTARFLHACLHAVLGDYPPRVVPLRDVAQMLFSGRLDAEEVVAMARAWRSEAVVRRAVELACVTLGIGAGDELAEALSSIEAPRRQLRALRSYESPSRSYVRLCVEATRAIPRLSDKARYLVALGFPDAEFAAGRYSGRTERWWRAARVLLKARRGSGRRSIPRAPEAAEPRAVSPELAPISPGKDVAGSPGVGQME